jgi:hypothetical protein
VGLGSFAGFSAFTNDFKPVDSPATASSFNLSNLSSSSDFVPKSKGGGYPELGSTASASSDTKKKDEKADPCHGKPKEFFIYG